MPHPSTSGRTIRPPRPPQPATVLAGPG